MYPTETQAVILAGGLGTRLWPLTKDIPKAMVPIGGVPYLEHQLRYLRVQGIARIVLLTGHLGWQIEDHFGNGHRLSLSICYSRESKPLGTGGALRAAIDLLDQRFLVIYGDSFLPVEYAAVLSVLDDPQVQGVIAVYDNQEDTSVSNNVALDANGCVVCYDKSGRATGLSYVEAGLLAFRRDTILQIPMDRQVSLEEETYPLLIARRELKAWTTTQRFYDIGTPERLRTIEKVFTELSHDHHPYALPH